MTWIARLLGVDRIAVIVTVWVLGAMAVALVGWRVYSTGYDAGKQHVQAKWDKAEQERAAQAAKLAGALQLGMDVTGTELVVDLGKIRAETRPIRERIRYEVETVPVYRDAACSVSPDRLRDVNLLRLRTDPGTVAVDRGAVPAAAAPR